MKNMMAKINANNPLLGKYCFNCAKNGKPKVQAHSICECKKAWFCAACNVPAWDEWHYKDCKTARAEKKRAIMKVCEGTESLLRRQVTLCVMPSFRHMTLFFLYYLFTPNRQILSPMRGTSGSEKGKGNLPLRVQKKILLLCWMLEYGSWSPRPGRLPCTMGSAMVQSMMTINYHTKSK